MVDITGIQRDQEVYHNRAVLEMRVLVIWAEMQAEVMDNNKALEVRNRVESVTQEDKIHLRVAVVGHPVVHGH